MTNGTSRRKVLLGIGTGATMALAGCNGTPGNGEPSPSTFEYPEGFSEEGIEEFATAMGTESAHYNAESFTSESEYVFEQADSEEDQEITATSQVSGANQTQYYVTETPQIKQEQYHDGTKAYLRYYMKEQDQEQFQVQQTEFSREGAYMLSLFRDQFKNVDFEVDEVLSENEVRYIATKEDMPDDHAFLQQYEAVPSVTLTFTVNTDGYITESTIELTRENEDGTELDESYSFTFSKFNETTVEEPDWIDKAEAAQQEQQEETSEDTTEDQTTTTTTDSSE